MSEHRCQSPKCKSTGPKSASDARAVGWMVWEGETIGGKSTAVCFCPIHAGRTEEAVEAQETGFDAHCWTCGDDASDEGDFEGTEEAAEAWAEEHECEPDTHVTRPKAKTAVRA